MVELWNKCDACGKLISYKDFDYMNEGGKAMRKLKTPESEFTSETWETLCARCRPGVSPKDSSEKKEEV